MTEIKKFTKGDCSPTYCEVWVNDEYYFGDVRTENADKFIDLLNVLIDENKALTIEKKALIQAINDSSRNAVDMIIGDNWCDEQTL